MAAVLGGNGGRGGLGDRGDSGIGYGGLRRRFLASDEQAHRPLGGAKGWSRCLLIVPSVVLGSLSGRNDGKGQAQDRAAALAFLPAAEKGVGSVAWASALMYKCCVAPSLCIT